MRDKLLANGVKNLREFGYDSANTTNILTDYVFRKFFRTMLTETLEEFGGRSRAVRAACEGLIAEIDALKDTNS